MTAATKQEALVGHKEACRILGVSSGNLDRVANLPPSLQDRGIEGFEVSVTRLWPRDEIEALAAARVAKRTGE